MAASTSLSEALTLYETEYLAARNLAVRSRKEYLNDLKDLLVFLTGTQRITDPGKVTKQHLERYLAELDRRGFSGATRRRKVASIRSFFGFLQDAGIITLSPALKLIPRQSESETSLLYSQSPSTRGFWKR
jgi:site-specific recombinase XerD